MKVVTADGIYGLLNVYVPSEAMMSFDDAGFLVGGREIPVSAVLLALDITPDMVGEATWLGAELITNHHPVTLQSLRRMGPQGVPYPLTQRSIGTICIYTDLDLALGGVNTYLTEALDLEDIHEAKPYGADGLWEGLIGNPPRHSSPTEFAEYVRRALNCGRLEYVGGGKPMQTAALCGGAGVDLLEDAVRAGVGAFVTADTKHCQLLLAEQLGITLMDAGHLDTEDIVILPLKENLQE